MFKSTLLCSSSVLIAITSVSILSVSCKTRHFGEREDSKAKGFVPSSLPRAEIKGSTHNFFMSSRDQKDNSNTIERTTGSSHVYSDPLILKVELEVTGKLAVEPEASKEMPAGKVKITVVKDAYKAQTGKNFYYESDKEPQDLFFRDCPGKKDSKIEKCLEIKVPKDLVVDFEQKDHPAFFRFKLQIPAGNEWMIHSLEMPRVYFFHSNMAGEPIRFDTTKLLLVEPN